MSNTLKYFISLCTGVALGAICVLWFQAMDGEAKKKEAEVASIKWRQGHFVLSDENLYNELIAQGVDYPEIVTAQAILETGHYKSYSCKVNNNLFGLRRKDGVYMSFDHWTDAVASYKKYIQKYDLSPKDYYKYLNELGYAQDSNYIAKLRKIVISNIASLHNQ